MSLVEQVRQMAERGRLALVDLWASWRAANPPVLLETVNGFELPEDTIEQKERQQQLVVRRRERRRERQELQQKLGGKLVWCGAVDGMVQAVRGGYAPHPRYQGSPWAQRHREG